MRRATRIALTPLRVSLRLSLGLSLGLSTQAVSHGLRAGSARLFPLPDVTSVPEGRVLDLPGGGRTYVVDVPGPTPDAPTVLLLHGLATTSHLTWFTTIDLLSRRYRVVLLDLPWHGRGTRERRFRLDDCADDAAGVLDVLGIESAIAVGYSLGGAVAQVMWRRHPDRVAGLVLCSTSGAWIGRLAERLFFPTLGVAMRPLSGLAHDHVTRLAATLPEVPSCDLTSMSRWGYTELRSTSAWSLPEVMAELGRFDSGAWRGEIDVPTSVVVTLRDRAIEARRQRQLAATIPGAVEFLAPGGHTSLMFDLTRWRPIFLDAVADVAARLPAPHRQAG